MFTGILTFQMKMFNEVTGKFLQWHICYAWVFSLYSRITRVTGLRNHFENKINHVSCLHILRKKCFRLISIIHWRQLSLTRYLRVNCNLTDSKTLESPAVTTVAPLTVIANWHLSLTQSVPARSLLKQQYRVRKYYNIGTRSQLLFGTCNFVNNWKSIELS